MPLVKLSLATKGNISQINGLKSLAGGPNGEHAKQHNSELS
jgi:hypothetical protein